MTAMGCDFCSVAEAPEWVYPCEDFEMGHNMGSQGAWLACGECASLIEAEAWLGLAERTVSIVIAGSPLAAVMRGSITERVRELHRSFQQHRKTDEPRRRFG